MYLWLHSHWCYGGGAIQYGNTYQQYLVKQTLTRKVISDHDSKTSARDEEITIGPAIQHRIVLRQRAVLSWQAL